MAQNAFYTFIPLSVDSDARSNIIFDFFDLLLAIAAHSGNSGFHGRKLSRLAGWWAFEDPDNGEGFSHNYASWAKAANATTHLSFAYLRSLSPSPGSRGISNLPLSLQLLLQETEYPSGRSPCSEIATQLVQMEVKSALATPFELIRLIKNFCFRNDDRALSNFAKCPDQVKALTDECQRILRFIVFTYPSSHLQSLKLTKASEDISVYEDEEEEAKSLKLNASAKNMSTRSLDSISTKPAIVKEFDLDDTFWWVWISSLASEETDKRRSTFGRSVLVEMTILGGRWFVFEEIVVETA